MWRLWALLFRIEYVLLIDFEQEWKVRRVRRRPDGMRYADFFGWGIGRVYLMSDGKCAGPASYVRKWIALTGPNAKSAQDVASNAA